MDPFIELLLYASVPPIAWGFPIAMTILYFRERAINKSLGIK